MDYRIDGRIKSSGPRAQSRAIERYSASCPGGGETIKLHAGSRTRIRIPFRYNPIQRMVMWSKLTKIEFKINEDRRLMDEA